MFFFMLQPLILQKSVQKFKYVIIGLNHTNFVLMCAPDRPLCTTEVTAFCIHTTTSHKQTESKQQHKEHDEIDVRDTTYNNNDYENIDESQFDKH